MSGWFPLSKKGNLKKERVGVHNCQVRKKEQKGTPSLVCEKTIESEYPPGKRTKFHRHLLLFFFRYKFIFFLFA